MMMNIGDFVSVSYATGEVFSGNVTKIRAMEPGDGHETERVLFTVKTVDGYRSLYLHKCASFDVLVTA